jgi:hypothetical protein
MYGDYSEDAFCEHPSRAGAAVESAASRLTHTVLALSHGV